MSLATRTLLWLVAFGLVSGLLLVRPHAAEAYYASYQPSYPYPSYGSRYYYTPWYAYDDEYVSRYDPYDPYYDDRYRYEDSYDNDEYDDRYGRGGSRYDDDRRYDHDDEYRYDHEYHPKGSVGISLHSGDPGMRVTMAGSAFPRDTRVTLYIGPKVAGTVYTDSRGNFQTVVRVPELPRGLYDVTATGAHSANPPTFYVEHDAHYW
jgi:hypothetical protein